MPPLGLGDAALEERDLVPLDRLRSEPAGNYGLRPREIDILRLDCGPRHRDAQSHLDIVGIGIDRRLRAPECRERRRPSLRPCVEHRTPEHRLRIFRDEVGRKHAPGFRCAVRARERKAWRSRNCRCRVSVGSSEAAAERTPTASGSRRFAIGNRASSMRAALRPERGASITAALSSR